MKREKKGPQSYWERWASLRYDSIQDIEKQILLPTGNARYRPQFVYTLVTEYLELILVKYSRGEKISDLVLYFEPLIDAWEESNRLGAEVFTLEQKVSRRRWNENLDHYVICFWLVGIAIILNVSERSWSRLLLLVDNEGEDALLDRLIATRQKDRLIGTALCHSQPYALLLKALEAPKAQQADLLYNFVDKWYSGLNREGTKSAPAAYRRPYWYTFGDENFDGGAYFGRWCIEAAAIVKAFGLDDSLCLGHENYPGDLLRPDALTTLQIVKESPAKIKTSWFKRMFNF